MMNTKWNLSILKNINFEESYLSDANFRLAKLFGVDFSGSVLYRAKFDNAIIDIKKFKYNDETLLDDASFKNVHWIYDGTENFKNLSNEQMEDFLKLKEDLIKKGAILE